MIEPQPKLIITCWGDRWYGRIPNSDDGHGHEIDCFLNSPQEALACLLDQWHDHLKRLYEKGVIK